MIEKLVLGLTSSIDEVGMDEINLSSLRDTQTRLRRLSSSKRHS